MATSATVEYSLLYFHSFTTYTHTAITTMASRVPRAIISMRASAIAARPVTRSFFTVITRPTFRPTATPASAFITQRYKSTERSAWAKEPMISYEELKPITQQPNDVCTVSVFLILTHTILLHEKESS
jgi:hypothetical protein